MRMPKPWKRTRRRCRAAVMPRTNRTTPSSRTRPPPATRMKRTRSTAKGIGRTAPGNRLPSWICRLIPTTTIGSFPADSGSAPSPATMAQGQIDEPTLPRPDAPTDQEGDPRAGGGSALDVLVHGEAERNDMVEHFGERLQGFAFSRFGWVQSYGSRCVKPPILHSDVHRPEPITVEWFRYAQIADRKTGQRHVDRSGDHPQLVFRAR